MSASTQSVQAHCVHINTATSPDLATIYLEIATSLDKMVTQDYYYSVNSGSTLSQNLILPFIVALQIDPSFRWDHIKK